LANDQQNDLQNVIKLSMISMLLEKKTFYFFLLVYFLQGTAVDENKIENMSSSKKKSSRKRNKNLFADATAKLQQQSDIDNNSKKTEINESDSESSSPLGPRKMQHTASPSKEMDFEEASTSTSIPTFPTEPVSTPIIPVNNDTSNKSIDDSQHSPNNRNNSNQPDENDMNVDNSDSPPLTTNDNTFIKIPKLTRYSAASPFAAVPGKSTWEKIDNLDHHFSSNQSYAGAKTSIVRSSRERIISIYFDNKDSLEEAIKEPITSLNNLIFDAFYLQKKNLNLSEKRQAEANRTIKVSDIPLNVKSYTISNVFSKFGTIERIGLGLNGKWQHAYIVFKDPASIASFYDDTWSIMIINDSVRVSPLNLSDQQLDDRQQYCLKLSGFPHGSTARDLFPILTQKLVLFLETEIIIQSMSHFLIFLMKMISFNLHILLPSNFKAVFSIGQILTLQHVLIVATLTMLLKIVISNAMIFIEVLNLPNFLLCIIASNLKHINLRFLERVHHILLTLMLINEVLLMFFLIHITMILSISTHHRSIF